MHEIYKSSDRVLRTIRMIDSGSHVTVSELLTALFDGISAVHDSGDTAKRLLDKYGSLANICDAPFDELCRFEGVGQRGAQLIKLCGAAVSNIISANNSNHRRMLYTYDDLVSYLRPYFINEKVENLYLLTLNSKYRVLNISLIAKGEADRLVFDKKLIIDKVIKYNASAVVLAHNHFTSILPSSNDVIVTNDLAQLLENMNVKLHDHIIFCENKAKSMRKSGYIKTKSTNLF